MLYFLSTHWKNCLTNPFHNTCIPHKRTSIRKFQTQDISTLSLNPAGYISNTEENIQLIIKKYLCFVTNLLFLINT